MMVGPRGSEGPGCALNEVEKHVEAESQGTRSKQPGEAEGSTLTTGSCSHT